ncbi:glycosyl hydrolase [Paenibacillus brasilensis]|uniref:Mannan endo-1,4-beta-mannosidase n=1 Tax=Paenibacillus brasilensis TaxID=128574 RepID=A0ABU0KXP2_9BACL|nr:glycosyl hydrolase [Paenibacillus brasilensis]MDQ0493013.1 mannan endo-1,4-beta-mannosidase [Paenibacillus brasilensis]
MKSHSIRFWLQRVLLLMLVLLFSGSQQSFIIADAAPPVNAQASAKARQLLAYLSNLPAGMLISGQHDYLEAPDEQNNKLQQISGQYAGLHGYEFGGLANQSHTALREQRQHVVDSAIRWSEDGGIVAITFHQALPGTPKTWKNVQAKITQAEFNRYVTPGTSQYKQLIADLDEAALSLKSLRDADVPVLWRPYHEMNGSWFWWGNKQNYAKLWDLMYDRFVRVHHLDNLLWVWSPNAPNAYSTPYNQTFPGIHRVDILAADIYNNDYKSSYYTELLKLAQGKPIGIGESDILPSAKVLQNQPDWAYAMSWGKELSAVNSQAAIRHFMNQNNIITRELLHESFR